MSALNDKIIFKLINDTRYQFLKTGEILKFHKTSGTWRDVRGINSKGYYIVSYDYTKVKAHRATWAAFYGNLESHLHINHKDSNKLNNNIENLELVTSSENQFHRYQQPNCGRKKLKFDDAIEIKSLWNNGIYTQKKLAEKYECSLSNIEHICAGRTFKTLKDGA